MPTTIIGSCVLKVIRYKKLGYTSSFNPGTGFFARIPDKGEEDPFWSPHGPELMDISITNWCDQQCSFCYRSSNKHGKHMALAVDVKICSKVDFVFLISSVKMGLIQMAAQ